MTLSDLIQGMHYLHGDVIEEEVEAACAYEYARESEVLREAASLWATKNHPTVIGWKIDEQYKLRDLAA
jgi:phosphoribosyl-ATP pyrophosphohydrolase